MSGTSLYTAFGGGPGQAFTVSVGLSDTPVVEEDNRRKFIFIQNITDAGVVPVFNKINIVFDDTAVFGAGGIILLPFGHFEGSVGNALSFSAINAILEPGSPVFPLKLSIQIGK